MMAILFRLVILVFVALVAGCGGGGGAAEAVGSAPVPLANRPAGCGYDHIYVAVEKVRIHRSGVAAEADSAVTEVTLSPARRIDLLALTGGVLEELGTALLPAGHYTQVRLVLASGAGSSSLANAVQPTGGAPAALSTPSAQQSGLKLQGDFLVPAGRAGDVVLAGADLCQAVVQAGAPGSPQYQLRPVLSASVQLATGTQETPIASGSVMPLMGGGYVVSRKQGTDTWVLQRYGADGKSVGGEAVVTLPAVSELTEIAPLAGGGYASAWLVLVEFQRFGQSVYNVFTQSFTATGAPIGSPVLIAPTIPGWHWFTRPLANPRVAGLAGGGYVLVWAQHDGVASFLSIYARRFNADGTPAGTVQQVAPTGNGYLGVIGLSTGGYLVTFGIGMPDGAARAFGPDDTPLGPAQPAGPGWADYPINDGAPPAMAPLAGGGAVIAWVLQNFPYVRVQQLAPDATPLAGPRIVDDSIFAPPSDTHSSPAVLGLPDGGYVVAWIEAGEVHARRFSANGTPAREETRINLVTTSAQPPVAVVAMADGGFMICWSGVGADGVRRNYGRAFPAGGLLATL